MNLYLFILSSAALLAAWHVALVFARRHRAVTPEQLDAAHDAAIAQAENARLNTLNTKQDVDRLIARLDSLEGLVEGYSDRIGNLEETVGRHGQTLTAAVLRAQQGPGLNPAGRAKRGF